MGICKYPPCTTGVCKYLPQTTGYLSNLFSGCQMGPNTNKQIPVPECAFPLRMRAFPRQITAKMASTSRGSRSSTAGSSETSASGSRRPRLRTTRDSNTATDGDIEATLTSAIAEAVSTVLRARGGSGGRQRDDHGSSDRDSDFEDPKPKRM